MTALAGDDLVIGFRDHDRQRYAAKVRLPEAGDFLAIGMADLSDSPLPRRRGSAT